MIFLCYIYFYIVNIQFYKYQGAGNDFVMVDNRENIVNHENPALIAKICDRRFGVGGDGMMFLQHKPGYDFEMIYYNSDGQPSSMCGNGGRCIVAFAKYLGVIETETNFLAVDGPHYATISESGDWVSLEMIFDGLINRDGDAYVLNTGSPHYIQLVDDLASKNVFHDGGAIRNNATYREKGINVNFIEPVSDGYFVRTFERGVEDETYACGSGVTASAIAMAVHTGKTGHVDTPVKVLGGDIVIHFDREGDQFSNIFLEGPAKMVFEGEIEV